MTGKPCGNDKYHESGNTGLAGKKKVKQSNHGIYTLPACMSQWADEPLYMVVARWGLLQSRWINRNDIVGIFHIPERQASFQLSYISRKKDRVACRSRYVPKEDGGRRRIEIFIDHILSFPEDEPIHAPPRRRNVPVKQTSPTSRGVGSAMSDNTGLWERLLKGCRKGRDDQ
ncbi:CaiF/GrlA family transcriptional regulator [Yokenella regensburgei]|jgi:hypothetical protein|uniref:CaiF/GrlA family transcriptional regulator n=1 Tax=Yokenella regensburgei TaxID=158877 RepID=UPI003EDAAC94